MVTPFVNKSGTRRRSRRRTSKSSSEHHQLLRHAVLFGVLLLVLHLQSLSSCHAYIISSPLPHHKQQKQQQQHQRHHPNRIRLSDSTTTTRTSTYLLVVSPEQLQESQDTGSTTTSVPEDDTTKATDGTKLPSTTNKPTTTKHLNKKIAKLCRRKKLKEALDLLDEAEQAMIRKTPGVAYPDHMSYTTFLSTWASYHRRSHRRSLNYNELEQFSHRILNLVSNGQYPAKLTPRTVQDIYHPLFMVYAKSYRRDAGDKCDALLNDLWDRYHIKSNKDDTVAAASMFRPTPFTYLSTLTAWSRSGKGRHAAERAEEILEEMEMLGKKQEFADLKPTTTCVNIVLNCWSKSGARDAHDRCESVLRRMVDWCLAGRTELRPTTVSFNTVLDALAQSKEPGTERRAEELLERMNELSNHLVLERKDATMSSYGSSEGRAENPPSLRADTCQPDLISFNTVLNGWARSRDPQAAQRADAILQHMEERYQNGSSDVQPDAKTYNTVQTAWTRSKNRKLAVQNAERVLQRMEKSFRDGNVDAEPNAISYNILINAWAQSRDPQALDRVLEIMETMKKLDVEEGRIACRPDCVTYTTVINAFAKESGSRKEFAETAIGLLQELEGLYFETDDEAFKPNVRTYLAAIHAIARSRTQPERAEAILERLETLYGSGDLDVRPDVTTYDALLNAFGWSDDTEQKSVKCYAIYQKMVDLYESRRNVFAKPDIITCNAVLNACAYEIASTETERAAIMEVAVNTLEDFQSAAPKFGWTNHLTYSNMLQAIDKQVTDPQKRADLAEATFWQCCQRGQVSVPVVTRLHAILTPSWERLSNILGDALCSNQDEPLHFNWKNLPCEWTQYAPPPKERRVSRPSRKQWSRANNIKPSTIRTGKEHQTSQ